MTYFFILLAACAFISDSKAFMHFNPMGHSVVEHFKLDQDIVKTFNLDLKTGHATNSDEKLDILVQFGDGSKPLQTIKEFQKQTASMTRSELLQAMTKDLSGHAEQKQATAIQFAKDNSMSHTCLWTTNQLSIRDATAEAILELAKNPEVTSIKIDRKILLDPIFETDPRERDTTSDQSTAHHPTLEESTPPSFYTPRGLKTYGLKTINVEGAWNITYGGRGARGKGVVVGGIDTGVRWTHLSLKENFRANKGWFDPYFGLEEPTDNNGHGTHTMSTIVGRYGFGVAPDAEWIACRGCDVESCTSSALLACGQFMLCPTNVFGEDPDCSLAPDVVSNSWGGGQNDPWYQNVVEAWQAAGIVPVFSIGNSGPECATANSPGDYPNVIGVGATNFDEAIASFSSLGPTLDLRLKPDISAPGVLIRSAWFGSDDDILVISGTSMACPMVSGVIALMLSINPNLKYETIKTIIQKTAERRKLADSKHMCHGFVPKVFPNNFYGHGRIDAYRSVQYAAYLAHLKEFGDANYGSDNSAPSYNIDTTDIYSSTQQSQQPTILVYPYPGIVSPESSTSYLMVTPSYYSLQLPQGEQDVQYSPDQSIYQPVESSTFTHPLASHITYGVNSPIQEVSPIYSDN